MRDVTVLAAVTGALLLLRSGSGQVKHEPVGSHERDLALKVVKLDDEFARGLMLRYRERDHVRVSVGRVAVAVAVGAVGSPGLVLGASHDFLSHAVHSVSIRATQLDPSLSASHASCEG